MNDKTNWIMILSPSKGMNLEEISSDNLKLLPSSSTRNNNEYCCQSKTTVIVEAMKKHSQAGKLKQVLKVSDKVAAVAKGYWDDFDVSTLDPSSSSNNTAATKPAVMLFDGDAYQGLDINTLITNPTATTTLHNNLRIIDAVYGPLAAFDRIQPYRLEMATRDVPEKGDKLPLIWIKDVTRSIIRDLNDKNNSNKLLINLASDEYSSAVDMHLLQESDVQVIKCTFKTNGKMASVYSKRARGLMARYLAENISTASSSVVVLDCIAKFDYEGYKYCESSSSEFEYVFDRPSSKTSSVKKKTLSSSSVKTKKAVVNSSARKSSSKKRKMA